MYFLDNVSNNDGVFFLLPTMSVQKEHWFWWNALDDFCMYAFDRCFYPKWFTLHSSSFIL